MTTLRPENVNANIDPSAQNENGLTYQRWLDAADKTQLGCMKALELAWQAGEDPCDHKNRFDYR